MFYTVQIHVMVLRGIIARNVYNESVKNSGIQLSIQ
jgi:hypothetical protein